MLRADVGKSLLPDRYRGIGSATLQIMILKPLKWAALLFTMLVRPRRPARPFVRLDASGNMRFLQSRDCYSAPEDVYRVAKARGMDLVDDHGSRLDRRLPRVPVGASRRPGFHRGRGGVVPFS